MPAITRRTDREEAIALPTGLLTEGLVHGGDARRTPADWTSRPNRGTTRTTGSVCRRARRSRGPGGPSGPSSSLPLRYPKPPGPGHNGAMDAAVPVDANSRAHRNLQNRADRGFAQRPQPSSTRENNNLEKPETRPVPRPLFRFARSQVNVNTEKRIPVKRWRKCAIEALKSGRFARSHQARDSFERNEDQCRNASTGSSRAARNAGYVPENNPIPPPTRGARNGTPGSRTGVQT